MRFSSDIRIERTPEQVWTFLGDPANVAKWDRGVARVEENPATQRGLGFEFETFAHDYLNLPDQGRMSYRISELDQINGKCAVELTSRNGNAKYFRSAVWHFHVQPENEGTRLTCTAAFRLRPLYFALAPLLYWKRDAILLDLQLLKSAVETEISHS